MAAEFLLVTVVMGVLLVGAGVAIARIRGSGRSASTARAVGRRLPARAGATDAGHSETLGLALVVLLLGVAVIGAVTDPVAAVFVALPALLGGYFAWGIYSLARARGIPRAHSIGVSAWLFGVVLVGVLAVKLLLG